MLTIIRNGYASRKKAVSLNYSKFKHSLAGIFEKNGFISKVGVSGRTPSTKKIDIELKYGENGEPAIEKIEKVSKSSRRVYVKSAKTGSVRQGFGILIVSTSKGLMTGSEAKKQKLGGEIICKVY